MYPLPLKYHPSSDQRAMTSSPSLKQGSDFLNLRRPEVTSGACTEDGVSNKNKTIWLYIYNFLVCKIL